MNDSIFRHYDIRGVVGAHLSIDGSYDLAKAIASYFKTKQKVIDTVVIGMDGRTHSPAIKERVAQGLIDSGFNVVFIGICPTPAVLYAVSAGVGQAAIMITASHNPKEYNGLKIFVGTTAVWGAELQEVRRLFKAKKRVVASTLGEYEDRSSVIGDYVSWLARQVADLRGSSVNAVFDCGNGATGPIVSHLIRALDLQNIKVLYDRVDGTYPHHEADPTIAHNMQAVKERLRGTDALIGIGFDGDGDRMAAMTKEGELVSGDKMLGIFSDYLLSMHPGRAVVFDVRCSSGLIDIIRARGGTPIPSPSGCSNIKEKMLEHDALIGGELSGHFVFGDHSHGADDGIYSALKLLQMLRHTGKTLSELLHNFPQKCSSPEWRFSCSEDAKQKIIGAVRDNFTAQRDVKVSFLDGVCVYKDKRWGIVRPSNTQPAVSVRCEADSPEDLKMIKREFYEVLLPYFDELILKREMDV